MSLPNYAPAVQKSHMDAIVQGNAKHKLGRLHYVHESMEEVANASTARHSTNK
jgi:hypothetical protein